MDKTVGRVEKGSSLFLCYLTDGTYLRKKFIALATNRVRIIAANTSDTVGVW